MNKRNQGVVAAISRRHISTTPWKMKTRWNRDRSDLPRIGKPGSESTGRSVGEERREDTEVLTTVSPQYMASVPPKVTRLGCQTSYRFLTVAPHSFTGDFVPASSVKPASEKPTLCVPPLREADGGKKRTCEAPSPYFQSLCTAMDWPFQENCLSEFCRPREPNRVSDWDETGKLRAEEGSLNPSDLGLSPGR